MKITGVLRRSKALPFYYSPDALKYVEQAHNTWQSDKHALNGSWSNYFDSVQKGEAPIEIKPLDIGSFQPVAISGRDNLTSVVESMYNAFLSEGHFWANTNPLDLPRAPPHYKDLYVRTAKRPSPLEFGLTPNLLFQMVDIEPFGRIRVSDLIEKLETALCGPIGYEFSHVSDKKVIDFFQKEIFNPQPLTLDDRISFLDMVTRAGLFEMQLKKAFPTSKRFGLEGLESLIVALHVIKERCLDESIESLVIGMAHRGRLNALCNIMQKPLDVFFAEFRGKNTFGTSEWGNTGDVKYHMGRECSYFRDNHELKVSLLSNPSHLEFVNPIVCGRSRAKVDLGNTVIPVIIHGDASMGGQGIVYETVQLGLLEGYTTGGTIHITANNQIGFTTYPIDGASSCYCTDVAKVVNAPILHVNSADVEAVAFAASLAMKFKQKFNSDIFLDLIGYRLMGHNELDMPKFTNPSIYSIIDKQEPIHVIYSKYLLNKDYLTDGQVREIESNISNEFNTALDKSKEIKELPQNASCEVMNNWIGLYDAKVTLPSYNYDISFLKDLTAKLSTLPPGFKAHPSVDKIFKQRLSCIESGEGIDYGLAELLCYSALAKDGFRVRLSGQDSQRGTFSHRHALVHDQDNFSTFNVFSAIPNGHLISVYNSPLNETASLGFEYGYGLEDPKILPIWEAQFGDFANVAQPIIDEFVCSSETKWNQSSAITLLLPHGYDGQGPDHSSCRVERFLQLCDDSPFDIQEININCDTELHAEIIAKNRNMSVVNCTTPANLFHAITRQMHRSFRKPLIVCSGKKLLKLKQASSCYEDFSSNSFQRLIPDFEMDPSNVSRIIFCTGQIYYDLRDKREELGLTDVAIERIEQISPFPYDLVMKSLNKYNSVKNVTWCQEEPENSGCWTFVYPWFLAIFKNMKLDLEIKYIGPRILSAPSTGDMKQHEKIHNNVLTTAFNIN